MNVPVSKRIDTLCGVQIYMWYRYICSVAIYVIASKHVDIHGVDTRMCYTYKYTV